MNNRPKSKSIPVNILKNVPKNDHVNIKICNSKMIYSNNENDNQEKIVLRRTPYRNSRSKCYVVKNNSNFNKNNFETKLLNSRSNKRLLRNLNKPPLVDRKNENNKNYEDVIVKQVNSNNDNKKKTIKESNQVSIQNICQLCKKKLSIHEEKIRSHYRIAHDFVLYDTDDCETLLIRMKVDKKKYFNFCCLSCSKKFNHFDNLFKHRCKNVKKNSDQRRKFIPTSKSNTKPTEKLINYNDQDEFFKNLGMKRINQSVSNCTHVKNRQIITRKQSENETFLSLEQLNMGHPTLRVIKENKKTNYKTLSNIVVDNNDDDVIITKITKR